MRDVSRVDAQQMISTILPDRTQREIDLSARSSRQIADGNMNMAQSEKHKTHTTTLSLDIGTTARITKMKADDMLSKSKVACMLLLLLSSG